jgi:hypothetical protein
MIQRFISIIKERKRIKYLSRNFEESNHKKLRSYVYFNLFTIAFENSDDPLAGNCCHNVTNVTNKTDNVHITQHA